MLVQYFCFVFAVFHLTFSEFGTTITKNCFNKSLRDEQSLFVTLSTGTATATKDTVLKWCPVKTCRYRDTKS